MGRHEIPLLESTQNDRHEPCNSYCNSPIPDIDEISVVADQSKKRKRDETKPFITFVGSVPKDSRILNLPVKRRQKLNKKK